MKPVRFSILTILVATALIAIACAILRLVLSVDSMNLAFVLIGVTVVAVLGTLLLPIAIIAASIMLAPRKDPQGLANPNRIVSFLLGLLVVDIAVLVIAFSAGVLLLAGPSL